MECSKFTKSKKCSERGRWQQVIYMMWWAHIYSISLFTRDLCWLYFKFKNYLCSFLHLPFFSYLTVHFQFIRFSKESYCLYSSSACVFLWISILFCCVTQNIILRNIHVKNEFEKQRNELYKKHLWSWSFLKFGGFIYMLFIHGICMLLLSALLYFKVTVYQVVYKNFGIKVLQQIWFLNSRNICGGLPKRWAHSKSSYSIVSFISGIIYFFIIETFFPQNSFSKACN